MQAATKIQQMMTKRICTGFTWQYDSSRIELVFVAVIDTEVLKL